MTKNNYVVCGALLHFIDMGYNFFGKIRCCGGIFDFQYNWKSMNVCTLLYLNGKESSRVVCNDGSDFPGS